MRVGTRTATAFVALFVAWSIYGDTLAIRNVNVISMRDDRIDTDQTVIVDGDHIVAIGPSSTVPIPVGMRTIDGTGQWLIPGLIDSHVHIRRVDLSAYLATGVTTVRDLAGLDSVLDTASRVARGELLGPRIIKATLLINGPNPRNPQFSTVIEKASDADAVVTTQLGRGCVWVKLYENLPLDVYDALIHAARAHGARIAGHVSVFVDVHHAIDSQDSIEHLNGYERVVSLIPNAAASDIGAWQVVDRTKYAALAQYTADHAVWNCPTLYVYAVLSNFSSQIIANRRAFIAELHARGARLVAGTDAGYLVPAGSSLIEELRELEASGLSRYETLKAATADAAVFLGLSDTGTIEVGKRADLVLLRGNPLDAIEALRDPALVIAAGQPIVHPRRRAVRVAP